MNWKLANARPGNTFDAHRLIALAASQNKSAEMNERLFRAYFSEGLLLSDHGVLESLAGDIGILDTSSLWVSPLFVDEVRHDENQAGELGISGVPSLLIDGKFMVVGAQGSDQLLSVLQRAWARRTAA
jgi:predicted DsbA family dithiol-disulfide isomerase